MPNRAQGDFMAHLIEDAMKRPIRALIIDKPQDQWNEEDNKYFHRQTCGAKTALGIYGYHILWLGEDRYRIKRGSEDIEDVTGSRLEQTIKNLVEFKRDEENRGRLLPILIHTLKERIMQIAGTQV